MHETAQRLYHSLENHRWSFFLEGKELKSYSEMRSILATDEWADPNIDE